MKSKDMPIRQNTDGTLYTEEEYMKIFSKNNHQPKKRGRPFGSKNTGITKKNSGNYYLKISHKEIILSFD